MNVLKRMKELQERQETTTDCSPPPAITEAAPEEPEPTIQILLRENAKLRTKLIESTSKDEIIFDAFRDAAQAIPPVNPLPEITHTHKSKKCVAVAFNSDMQIGTFVQGKYIGGLNDFGFDEFLRRMAIWVDKIITITDVHRNAYDVDILDIPVLGDNVEGEGIFPSQPHFIDLPVIEQVFQGGMAFAWGLRTLLEKGRFKKIRTRWVAGNHGRPGMKGHGHPASNWDTIFAVYVQSICSQIPEIEFHISESNFMLYRIEEAPDYLWLITHGDQIKGSLSIPYYGFDRAFRNYAQLSGQPINYMAIGHHHRKAVIDNVRGEQIMNGNWIGGTDLSVSQMITAGHAKQIFSIVDPDYGIIASHDIFLKRLHDMTMDSNLIYTPTRSIDTSIPRTLNALSTSCR